MIGIRSLFLFASCLAVPFIVVLRQLLHVPGAEQSFKVLMGMGILLFVTSATQKLAQFNRSSLTALLFLFIYGVVLTPVSISWREVSLSALISHVIGCAAFLIFVAGYDPSVGRRAFLLFSRYRWWLIGVDAIVLAAYRWNPFDAEAYAGFESTAIMPTFILSIKERKAWSVLLHLGLFFAHDKRANALMALGIVLIVLFYSIFQMRLIARFFVIGSIIGAILLLWFSLAGPLRGIVESDEKLRSLTILYALSEGSVSVDGSLEEKASEIVLAYRSLMSSPVALILGNGFGWTYDVHLEFSEMANDESEHRHYLHFTPAFIHICFGVVGLIVYFLLWGRAVVVARSSVEDYASFWAAYLLFCLAVGLSVLNLFTEPIVAFAVGSVCHKILKRPDIGAIMAGGHNCRLFVAPNVV